MATKWFGAVERSVVAFTAARCVRGPLFRERTVDLYRAWLAHGGEASVSAVMFTRVLRSIQGLDLEKSRGGYSVIGIKLNTGAMPAKRPVIHEAPYVPPDDGI